MDWPCGPLAVARLAAKQAITPELKETLEAWAKPQALEILQGSPVNCLIVPWAEGSAEDQGQQQSLEPLLRAAKERGISFVGTVAGKQDHGPIFSAGTQAGLAAFMVESLEGVPKDAPVILRTPRSGVPWESVTPTFCLTGNLWPRLGLDTVKEADEASAGPTGVPWVNSNGWLSLLARNLSRPKPRTILDPRRSNVSSDITRLSLDLVLYRISPGKTVWLDYDPPESSDLDHPAGYALAVADGCAYGSRWVISLDDHLRRGLTQKDPRAIGIWEKIVSTVGFFNGKGSWTSFRPRGFLAVVSDFRGDNESLATEILNLLARRHVQYKIIERSIWPRLRLDGLKAVLWVDSAEPDFVRKPQLRSFVEQGGLLIAPKPWWPVKSAPKSGGLLDHFQVYSFGNGSIAVPREGMTDPYEVAFDTHMLMSRRNDLVRIFNVTACNTLCTADLSGRKRLVQILNYASSGRQDLASIWVRTTNRTARYWSLGAAEPVTLRGVRSRGGWEFQLPFISTYAALEFDLRGA